MTCVTIDSCDWLDVQSHVNLWQKHVTDGNKNHLIVKRGTTVLPDGLSGNEEDDVTILGWNEEGFRLQRWQDCLSLIMRRRRAAALHETSVEFFDRLRDVSCYTVSEDFLKSISSRTAADVIKPRWSLNSINLHEDCDIWDEDAIASPILVSHVLRIWKGSKMTVYGSPLFSLYGFDVNFIHIALASFCFLCGLLGFPSWLPMRLLCITYIFDVIETGGGGILKVIFVLVVCRLIYAAGRNPL